MADTQIFIHHLEIELGMFSGCSVLKIKKKQQIQRKMLRLGLQGFIVSLI